MLKRIYLLVAAVVVLAVVLGGLLAADQVRTLHTTLTEDRLVAAIRTAEAELGAGRTAAEAVSLVASGFGRGTGEDRWVRLTLVDRQGVVLADSEEDPAAMDNHRLRPEIAQAFDTRGTGRHIRRSPTLEVDMLYLARYSAERDLVVRAAIPLSDYNQTLRAILWRLSLVLGGSLLGLLAIGLLVTRWIGRPLRELRDAALQAADGRLDIHVAQLPELDRDTEVGQLARAFDTMRDRLRSILSELEDRNARLDAILDSMDEPLAAVDVDCGVTFLNAAARDAFFDGKPLPDRCLPLLAVIRNGEAERILALTLSTRTPQHGEARIETRKGRRIYRIHAAPIGSRGAMAAFSDMTEIVRLQQVRSDFVANVTHELKTPLTSIRGFIDTLRRGAVRDPEVVSRFLDIIDIEAERLHALISDILTLSEIESSQDVQDREAMDLTALVDDVLVLLDEAASRRRVTLVNGPPPAGGKPDGAAGETAIGSDEEAVPEPFPIRANRLRIHQLLMNLVDNAVKYNREGGTVWIWGERALGGRVTLHVRDDGPGIEPEHQSRIFERFYRVDRGRSREMGGTGLGLAIVKHIAQLYRGAVSVESVPGQGAEFLVSLEV